MVSRRRGVGRIPIGSKPQPAINRQCSLCTRPGFAEQLTHHEGTINAFQRIGLGGSAVCERGIV
jgi:hypothetical protein